MFDQLLGTPDEIETIVKLETEQAKADWAALWDEAGFNPPEVPVGADTGPAEDSLLVFEDSIVSSDPALAPVGADTSGAQEEVTIWGSQVGDVPTSDVPVNADTEPAQFEVNLLEAAINDAGGTVEINGNPVPGDQVLDTLMGIINSSDGTVTINGMPVPAEEALGQAIALINSSDGMVEIDGDPSGAHSATDGAKRYADGSTGEIGVNAYTDGASRAIDYAARNRTSTITVFQSIRTSGSGVAKAAGGPVFGPGTETSDSIPARLSNNEHVFAAREVSAAGGHQAIYSLRQQLLAGAKTIHLATGGAADGSVGAVQAMPYMQAQSRSSGPVTATLPPGLIASEIRQGFESATVIAQVSDRVAANLYQRGKSGSRAYGGGR